MSSSASSSSPPVPKPLSDVDLAAACARGDAAAVRQFEVQLVPVAITTARRFGNADFAAEVAQQVRKRLLVSEPGRPAGIADYGGRGALAKYVQAVAVRTALNVLQSAAHQAVAQSDDAILDRASPADDPEVAALKLRYRTEFKEAFAAAMASLDEDVRSAVRLHYLDGLTLSNLGALYGWSVPTASRRIAAARAQLLESTRSAMASKLRLSPAELDSVLRLIESRLSVDGLGPG